MQYYRSLTVSCYKVVLTQCLINSQDELKDEFSEAKTIDMVRYFTIWILLTFDALIVDTCLHKLTMYNISVLQ